MHVVFAPAHFVSSLLGQDFAVGFLVANALLVGFGLWCWAMPVRSRWEIGNGLIWFWIVLELGNGVTHFVLAFQRGGYFPGLGTAPLLLFFAGWLMTLQSRKGGRKSASAS